MQAKLTPFVPPDHDPYEECFAGSHDGETMTIECDGWVTLEVKETRSGIGNSYKVAVVFKGGERHQLAEVYVDDDGENIIVREREMHRAERELRLREQQIRQSQVEQQRAREAK